MKIIDQTPLLDANGQLGLVGRLRGMLTYGFSWPASLDAQQKVIAQLDKALEKKYTLIRNQKLGASEIMTPMILVGPAGIYLLESTALKGRYRARGDEWEADANGRFQPAPINLLGRTLKLAKILQLFLERQGLKLAAPVEPVLLAANPGLHIESLRPAVRIVLSDAIGHFAANLLTSRPVYNATEVNEFVERIQNPRSAKQAQKPSEPLQDAFSLRENFSSQNEAFTFDEETLPAEKSQPDAGQSRMQAILHSPQSDNLIESGRSDIDFAFDEENSPTVLVSNPPPAKQDELLIPPKPRARARFLGMTIPQIALLVGLMLVEFCILAGSAAWFYFTFYKP